MISNKIYGTTILSTWTANIVNWYGLDLELPLRSVAVPVVQIDSFFVGQLQIDSWKIDLVRDPSTVGTTLELGLSDQIR